MANPIESSATLAELQNALILLRKMLYARLKTHYDDTTYYFATWLKSIENEWQQQPTTLFSAAILHKFKENVSLYLSFLSSLENFRRIKFRYIKPLLSRLADVSRDYLCQFLRKEIKTQLALSLANTIERLADTGKDDELIDMLLKQVAYYDESPKSQQNRKFIYWLQNVVSPTRSFEKYEANHLEEEEFEKESPCNFITLYSNQPPYVQFVERDVAFTIENKCYYQSAQELRNKLQTHRDLFEIGTTHSMTQALIALATDYLDERATVFGDFISIFKSIDFGDYKKRVSEEIIHLVHSHPDLTQAYFIRLLNNDKARLTRVLQKQSLMKMLFDCPNTAWIQIEAAFRTPEYLTHDFSISRDIELQLKNINGLTEPTL